MASSGSGIHQATALSGAAKQFQVRFKTRYLARLWEDSLLYDLLWYVWGDIARRPAEWRSPSWSWALVEEPVGFAYNPEDSLARINYHVNAECALASKDSTGAVSRGHLSSFRHFCFPLAALYQFLLKVPATVYAS